MTPEQKVQKQILAYLKGRKIWHRRFNTGRRGGIQFGSAGMADILATPLIGKTARCLWIEVKAPKGKQSEAQKAFEDEVMAVNHSYIVATSLDEVEAWLNFQRAA